MPTLKEMSRLYYLEKQIQADRERLAAIRARGSPGYGGSFGKYSNAYTADRTAEDALTASELEARISRKIAQAEQAELWLLDVLDRIDDPYVKFALTNRCQNGKSWTTIAVMLGGYNTADGVRKRCQRYLRRMPDGRGKKKKPDSRQIQF